MATLENENNFTEDKETAEFNKMFANRYTDEDDEYVKMAKSTSDTSPIVQDWGQNRNNYQSQQRYRPNSYRNNNNNRGEHQQYRNNSRDNNSRRDRSRSPPHHFRGNYHRDRSRSPPHHVRGNYHHRNRTPPNRYNRYE